MATKAAEQEKYSEDFSLGLVTTGGSLGLLFPPSIPIVLYGVVAGIRRVAVRGYRRGRRRGWLW